MNEQQPIIVIKKIVHGGHHGGAWKVAYADFVTAMMALFIVLWLLSSASKKEQQEIGGYFRDPKGTAANHGTSKVDPKKDTPVKEDMSKLRLDLMHAIEKIDTLNKLRKQIEITITEEGLRIELMESNQGTFFELGSAKPTPALVQLLRVLSAQLGTLPNSISVEGHTDSAPYAGVTTYGNWELSSDRANTARRLMQASGVRGEQVSQVRGFADQRLRTPDKPLDPSNRRISLIVQYLPDSTKDGKIEDVARMNAKSSAASQQEKQEAPVSADETKSSPIVKPPAAQPQEAAAKSTVATLLSHFHKKSS
jgi:chemotaxis protein MotB